MQTQMKKISERLEIALQMVFPGHSVSEMARKIGVHANTLQNYLKSARLPACEFLIEIAKLDVDIHWLLTGIGTPSAEDNPDRRTRIETSMKDVGDIAILAEVEIRMKAAIKKGTALLREFDAIELQSLARTIKSGCAHSELSEEERELVIKVQKAFWSLDNVMWYYPDLEPKYHDSLSTFFALHDDVTSKKPFRAIMYSGMYATVVASSTC